MDHHPKSRIRFGGQLSVNESVLRRSCLRQQPGVRVPHEIVVVAETGFQSVIQTMHGLLRAMHRFVLEAICFGQRFRPGSTRDVRGDSTGAASDAPRGGWNAAATGRQPCR